jgi:hypothetical protein
MHDVERELPAVELGDEGAAAFGAQIVGENVFGKGPCLAL